MGFVAEVLGQADVLRRVVSAYRGEYGPLLARAAARLNERPERPVFVIGMGSSLAAGRALPALFASRSRLALVEDAGELLHYGLGSVAHAGAIVAISQSGRSIETIRVVERLRAGTGAPIIGLVNDTDSPLAAAADVTLPLLTGRESMVATQTYIASVTVLLALAEAALPGTVSLEACAPAAAAIDKALRETTLAERAADHLGSCRAVALVARGPALGAAHYAALTLKETAGLPVEAMSGGAYRHGPLELAGSGVGLVVLAPDGPTAGLLTGLAEEVADTGARTWLLAGPVAAGRRRSRANLLLSSLPDLPEVLASLVSVVPLQLMAAELARRAGREVGVPSLVTKVTERE